MKVFISWSGERSHALAAALKEWIPPLLQSVDVWMSASDIEKGAMWDTTIAEHLSSADLGIVCLTPENLQSPWILFESGALSKRVRKSRLCTYLLGLRPQDVPPPLGLFQHTVVEKEDTRTLIQTINGGTERPLRSEAMNMLFDATWPQVEARLHSIPAAPDPPPRPRPLDQMVEELLANSRKQNQPSNESVLSKLQCIELAMMMNSYGTFGSASMKSAALSILNLSRHKYSGHDDETSAVLNPMWDFLAGLIAKKKKEEDDRQKPAPHADIVAASPSLGDKKTSVNHSVSEDGGDLRGPQEAGEGGR